MIRQQPVIRVEKHEVEPRLWCIPVFRARHTAPDCAGEYTGPRIGLVTSAVWSGEPSSTTMIHEPVVLSDDAIDGFAQEMCLSVTRNHHAYQFLRRPHSTSRRHSDDERFDE